MRRGWEDIPWAKGGICSQSHERLDTWFSENWLVPSQGVAAEGSNCLRMHSGEVRTEAEKGWARLEATETIWAKSTFLK